MAVHTLALPEVIAMLETVDVPLDYIAAFQKQAEFVIQSRAPLTRADDDFQVGSGYAHLKGTGHVKFKTGTVEHQLEPKKAKQIGHWLIEAAEAAINDQVVMALMKDVGFADAQQQGAILLKLREIRQGTRDVVYEN